MDDSNVCNDINITRSSTTGGKAQSAGGLYVLMQEPHDRMERKWNDSEHCNTPSPTTRICEKRLTIWNCDIQNNFATDHSGGIVMEISGFNYLSPQSSYNINILVTNTTLHGNQAVSAGGGNMYISYGSDSNAACNLISVSIERCNITEGGALTDVGGGLYIYIIEIQLVVNHTNVMKENCSTLFISQMSQHCTQQRW